MTLEEAEKRTEEARAYLLIDEKKAELANLDSRIAKPDFWNDTDNAQQVSKQASDIRDVIERYESACGLLDDIKTATELAEEDPEFGEEIEYDLERLEKLLDDLRVLSYTGTGLTDQLRFLLCVWSWQLDKKYRIRYMVI